MNTNYQSSTKPFSADTLLPTELEEILQRIDENLELRPLLLAGERTSGQIDDEVMLAPLPELSDLSSRIHAVRQFNAPYFLVRDSGVRGFIKRLVNLPLRVFGYKQALFNNHTLDMLDLLSIQVQALRHRSEQQATEERQQRRWLQSATNRLDHLMQELDEPGAGVAVKAETNRQRIDLLRADLETCAAAVDAVRDEISGVRGDVTTTRTDQHGHSAWIQQVVDTQQELARQLHGHTAWIQTVVHEQQELARQLHGHSDWITLVQREAQAAALSARTHGAEPAAGAVTATRQAPRIQDRVRYDALVAQMPDGLLVNLGCGIRPKDGWINVDFRPLPHVDVVADIRSLPFEPGTVAQFEAAHLVEHFHQHDMQQTILPYWRSLLKPGGTLRIVCPNLAGIVARSAEGKLSLAQVKDLLFGGQEYEGNDHFAMYWPESLQQMLTTAGFGRVEVLATDRENGICPEVEVLAYS